MSSYDTRYATSYRRLKRVRNKNKDNKKGGGEASLKDLSLVKPPFAQESTTKY